MNNNAHRKVNGLPPTEGAASNSLFTPPSQTGIPKIDDPKKKRNKTLDYSRTSKSIAGDSVSLAADTLKVK